MIFQLGKTKAAEDDAVREETFRRWREASQRSQTTDLDGSDAASGESPKTAEWPDPRSTISLTQEIESVTLVEPQQTHEPMAAATIAEPAPKTTTSKLAQFVSSGLNATGLLQSSTAKTPAKPALKPAPAREEGIRLVQKSAPAPVVERELPVVDDMKQRFGSNIRSALGPGTIIEGTFSFDSPVCIEGTLIGEVRSNSVLIVGAQASVNAKVKVGSLIVLGTVKGDVESEELVEIKNGGMLTGDVFSERFAIEDGGWFQGRCTPTPKKTRSEAVETSQELVGDDDNGTTRVQPVLGNTADRWSME